MGGKRQQGNSSQPTRGINVREWETGQCIRIVFRFKGVLCRETLKIEPTKANLKYAERLRGEIINAIALEWDDIDWLKGMVRVSRAVVLKQEKGTKTKSGSRDVLLLPPALEALKNQKSFTYLEGKRVFYNPRTNTPWETDGQIRKTCWAHILRKAGIRNPYQTRHTYASMMLSAGESSLWVAT